MKVSLTAKDIAKEQKLVFDELFTIEDIMKGDTIAMNKEAREIAVERLEKRAEQEQK